MQEAVLMLGSNLFGSPKCHSIDYIIPVIRHGHINFHKIPNICNWYKKLKDSNSYSSYPLLFPISEQKYSVRYNLGEQYEMWVNLANAKFERSCSSPFGYKSECFHILHILALRRMCSMFQAKAMILSNVSDPSGRQLHSSQRKWLIMNEVAVLLLNVEY